MRITERPGRGMLRLIIAICVIGPVWAAPAKLPDWSGVWVIPEMAFIQTLLAETNPDSPLAPPLRPENVARLKALGVRRITGVDPPGVKPRTNAEQCLPPGMPDIMRYPMGIEFLFTPGRVTLLIEEGPAIRRIYTDGRAHDDGAEPSFHGESVGHWEGTTLVVDTTAISTRAELIGGVATSGRAHVVERVALLDPARLEIDTVVEDPGALRAPWRYSRVYEKSRTPFREMVCLENNRERDGGEPDLTPPPHS